jgi:hypothetical protein
VIGALTAAVLAAGAAAPANGDSNLGTIAGLTYIQGDPDPSAPAPPPRALVSKATCTAGTHVVGGGAATGSSPPNPAAAEFWLNRSRPFDGADSDSRPDDGWIARGYNRFGTSKQLSSYAICLSGAVRYPTAFASAVAGEGMAARATCPSGMHVAGGGASIAGAATESYLNSSHPFDSDDADTRPDDGWRARGFNRSGPRKRLNVYAQCVDPLPRYASASADVSDVLLFTACPAGTHAMSGGGLATGAPNRAFLVNHFPYAAMVNPPDTGFAVWIHNAIGGPAVPVRSYVACKV